jgi:endogenous inhibitor of DNA gyrase (YacG/DUF329 family)
MDSLRVQHWAYVFSEVVRVKPGDPAPLGDGFLFFGEKKLVDLSDRNVAQDLLDATGEDMNGDALDEHILAIAKRYGPMGDESKLTRYVLEEYGTCFFEGITEWHRCIRPWRELLENSSSESRNTTMKNPTPGEPFRYVKKYRSLPTTSVATIRDVPPLLEEKSFVQGKLKENTSFLIGPEETFISINTLRGRGFLECAYALSGKTVIKQCETCGRFVNVTGNRERGAKWRFCSPKCQSYYRVNLFRYSKRIEKAIREETKLDINLLKERFKEGSLFDQALKKVETRLPCYKERGWIFLADIEKH